MPILLSCLLTLAPRTSPQELQIDPLLLAQVVEVFGLVAASDDPDWRNPVWPGWDASTTPILLYLPGVQDALLNHPRPPAGFHAVTTELLPPHWTLHVRDGKTIFALDGQNTSTRVGGIETLVVADPISNLRPGMIQLLRDGGSPHEKETALMDAGRFMTDPYEQLAFVVHEAFHVHQFRRAPGNVATESWLLGYPWLDASNLAGFELEGRLLQRALLEPNVEEVYFLALQLLAVRLERRRELSSESIRYEDGTEFSEGLAKYTEWALSRALEGREPGAPMRWARGFRGYGDLSFWRRNLLEGLRGHMNGSVSVNGDRYGAGSLRMRLYYSGMGLAAMLDSLQADDWQRRALEPGMTLTQLLADAVMATDDDLAEGLIEARASFDWEGCLLRKRRFEAQGWADAEARAQSILSARPLFTLDYRALPDASVVWNYTPFGITRLEDGRTIYGQVPLSATLASAASFEQTSTLPALHDAVARTIQFALLETVEPNSLPLQSEGPLELKLPGVTIQAAHGRLTSDGGGVRLELLGA